MGIGYMYFYNRRLNSLNSITDTYRCMGVGGGIEDNAIIGKPYFLKLTNNFPFNIGLVIS